MAGFMDKNEIHATKRVAIVWRSYPTDEGVSTLTYKPEGYVRTYDPDALDPRIGDVVKVTTFNELVAVLRKADGTKVAVPVRLASYFGPDWQFASESWA